MDRKRFKELPGETTSHRAFILPIEKDSYSTCYFKKRRDKMNLYETCNYFGQSFNVAKQNSGNGS